MNTKSECKNCTKSRIYGLDLNGKVIFGCQDIFCIFDPIVDNDIRNSIIEMYEKQGVNYGKNSRNN